MSESETAVNATESSMYRIKFGVFLALEIPSLITSLVIFGHFASSRAFRAADHQHSVIFLLLINFTQSLTDMTLALDFYHLNGVVRVQTATFCLWWTMNDFCLFVSTAFVMAWISVERHLLIFHRNFLGAVGTRKRRFFHVAPWIACLLLPVLFYTVIIVISPMCTTVWYFDALLCGQPCYFTTSWSAVDVSLTAFFPISVILIANTTLVVRVIRQRMTLAGPAPINWRKHRKMVLQLCAISTLYLSVWLPIGVMQLLQFYVDPTFLAAQVDTFYFLAYIGLLILPFVCITSIPQLSKRIKNIFNRRHQRAVAPVAKTHRRTPNGNEREMTAVVTRK